MSAYKRFCDVLGHEWMFLNNDLSLGVRAECVICRDYYYCGFDKLGKFYWAFFDVKAYKWIYHREPPPDLRKRMLERWAQADARKIV